ncbi:leucine-rich repeat domain-containing protein [Paraprevotella xylaniphila]|uniref:leucine-rich repeat domain-containing protein n=1 Tax=Paraprevotella xylaniphila TaxID=454155 RepID=UPI00031242C9
MCSVQTLCWQGHLQEIESYVFSDCRELYIISIPEGTKRIGSGAFNECHNLRYVSLPTSLDYIDDCAFKGCPCEELVRKNHVPVLSSDDRQR